MENAQQFDFIINRKSGTTIKAGEAQVEKDLREIFGEAAGNILFIDGQNITSSVKEWVAGHKSDEGRNLIVGGGDGTLLTAAGEVLNSGVTLGILPMGTQNFVCRGLGYSPDYKEAAAQYKNSTPHTMDVASINGMNFLYGTMIDRGTVNWFKAREKVREQSLKPFWRRNYIPAISNAFKLAAGVFIGKKTKLKLRWQEKGETKTAEEEARIIVISNNAVVPRPNQLPEISLDADLEQDFRNALGNTFAKGDVSDGQLVFYAHEGGPRPDILLGLWDGTWDQSPDISIHRGEEFTIEPSDSKDREKEIEIILDGEIKKTQYPLEIRIMPKSLRLFRPA